MNRKLKSIVCNIAYSPIGDRLLSCVGGVKLWADWKVIKQKRANLKHAKRIFKNGPSVGSLADYKHALDKHWVSYLEYAQKYEFYKKSEEERNEYVSRLRMAYFYWQHTPARTKSLFRNNRTFLKAYEKFIHRKWLFAPEVSFDDFEKLITSCDCIIKPCDGKLGKGIFKVYRNGDHQDDRTLYETCVKDRMLVEECIESCDELKAFHPQSLNTIRVVTIANKDKACVFSGVFRTGVGESVVDNSHKGGVSAQINVNDGVIETDGANTSGERFVCHPDSHITFKGFRIPKWDKIVETCCEAAKQTGNPITGWDVVVNQQGNIEFVEANYGPDMDMMQTRFKTGAKKKIYALIKEYCGITMKE